MHLQARRSFRLAATVALALVAAYALQVPLPFIAPLFALMLAAPPKPPMALKGLFVLVLVVVLSLGIGLILIPLLLEYPVAAVLLVFLGLYLGSYLSVHQGKALLGTFLIIGFTLISAAGTVSFELATTLIQSLVVGMIIAVVCQWLVYPWFPEDRAPKNRQQDEDVSLVNSNWIALRSTLIVLPVYLLALTDPLAYLAIIMKSVSLGQQSSLVNARNAGRELLGSTLVGGCLAVLFWMMLGTLTNLWMFFLLMLLFGLFLAGKIYQVSRTRFPASFWLNVGMTLLILLGPAVEDSDGGKDVYTAFMVRMGLFIAVTLYAWLAVYLLECLRERRVDRASRSLEATGSPAC